MLRTVVVLLAVAICALAQYDCPPPELNNCLYSNATDLRSVNEGSFVVVTFAYPAYDPPCIIVNVGQLVIFSGNFVGHPLQPGVANDTDVFPSTDPTTPFYITGDLTTVVDSGDSYNITFTSAGAFPYYCQVKSHATAGMRGVVYVDTGCVAPPMAPVAPPVDPPVTPPMAAPVAAPVAAAPVATPVKKASDAATLVFSAAALVGAALL